MGIVLLLCALLMSAPSPIVPSPTALPMGSEVRVVVRDLAGQPVAGVALAVSGARPPEGVTGADGAAVFVAQGEAVTITAARRAGKVLLLDHTDPAGLRLPLRGGAVTLELWLAEDQLFVPPATDEGPPPDDLATPTMLASQGAGGGEPTLVLAEPTGAAPTRRGGVGGSSALAEPTLASSPALIPSQEPARAGASAAPVRTPSPTPAVSTPAPAPAWNGWFIALVVVLLVVLPVVLLGWAQGGRECARQEGR